MKHIKIAICDDNKNEIKVLENLLSDFFNRQSDIKITVSTFFDPNALLEHLDFDILFLDILFGETASGPKALRQLRKQGVHAFVVFISSLQSFKASKIGFDYDVFNYIVKPFDAGEVCRILSQILKELEKIEGSSNRILLRNEDSVSVLYCDDIQYIDIVGRKRHVHTMDFIISTNRTLKSLYEELPEHQFTYTHNAYVVNLEKVDTFNAHNVFLTDGSEIPLSRSHKNAFYDAINLHIYKGIITHD